MYSGDEKQSEDKIFEQYKYFVYLDRSFSIYMEWN